MNSLMNFNEDQINTSMIEGLKKALGNELKVLLMETAEKEIDAVIDKLCKRVELNCNNYLDLFGDAREIKLEWLINNSKTWCDNKDVVDGKKDCDFLGVEESCKFTKEV